MRGRSHSYSPSPPRGYGRRYRSPSPPRGYGRRYRSPSPRRRYSHGKEPSGPTSLLVRNLRHDCNPEDLRVVFGRFGPIKDVYLPRDYYTKEPRGFGFVQFVDPVDAADAKYDMDGYVLLGRELTVVFAEENRKKPIEMREREHISRSRSYSRRRSSANYSRSPRHGRTYSRSPYDYSPRRSYSRSISPRGRSYGRPSYRERSYSRSSYGSRSRSRSPYVSRSRSRSPYVSSRSVTPGYSR